ncbi:MAG: hypothetical protein AAF589_08520 [Planctomycetota bacterium]
MRRGEQDRGELPGQDSFLDIVANIVGILILLVMVVGLRAANSSREAVQEKPAAEPAVAQAPAAPPIDAVTEQELADVVRQVKLQRADLQSKVVKAVNAQAEVEFRDAERVHLAAMVAAVEEEIEQQREKMGQDERRDFDLRSKLGAAEHQLEQLTRQRIALAAVEPEVEQVESLPTPLATTVSNDELHVRLAEGYAKLIPLDELIATARQNAEENVWRLETRDSAELTIGPVDGFRMKYLLRKYSVASRRGTSVYIGSAGWELLPVSPQLGEPVAEAVKPGSLLMTGIARQAVGKRPTVTIWTYPDSFGDFRDLKAALFDAGFSVAGRPLPAGKAIGGSPNGTKSAAQ